jgi:hypothetical protein
MTKTPTGKLIGAASLYQKRQYRGLWYKLMARDIENESSDVGW